MGTSENNAANEDDLVVNIIDTDNNNSYLANHEIITVKEYTKSEYGKETVGSSRLDGEYIVVLNT